MEVDKLQKLSSLKLNGDQIFLSGGASFVSEPQCVIPETLNMISNAAL